jgi:hypothetical protein
MLGPRTSYAMISQETARFAFIGQNVVAERLSRLNAAIDALRDGSGIVKHKRTMSAEARAKISKAAKLRWSKIKR